MKIKVEMLQQDRKFDLALSLLAGENGTGREIDQPLVQKPGLAIAGYFEAIQSGRVQILGNTEIHYLLNLAPTQQITAIEAFLATKIPCVVVTGDHEPPDSLIAIGNRLSIPIFRSQYGSGLFISHLHQFLNEYLSPEEQIHGVLIDLLGVGVLLLGASGIGKSECALDLVLRGHRLVADDVVFVHKYNRELVGRGSPLTRFHMEIRGLGIINLQNLFGSASVRETKRVDLVVELVEWNSALDVDRTGLEEMSQEFLGIQIPKVKVPIRPGRNLASIVQVAARLHLLKQQGHHSARELEEKLDQQLAGLHQE